LELLPSQSVKEDDDDNPGDWHLMKELSGMGNLQEGAVRVVAE
jgi:hypothetical protein